MPWNTYHPPLHFTVLGTAVDFGSLSRLLGQTFIVTLPFIVYDVAAIRQGGGQGT